MSAVHDVARPVAHAPLPMPNGWFALCRSDALRAGRARPLRAFGRELALFRGADGAARVLEAHCPHLGAHLGHGTVVGDTLACPLHAWRFGGDGACTHAPFARKLPVARTRALPVHEVNGLVFVHHDRDGRPPRYAIPALPYGGDGWSRPIAHTRTYAGHPIEAAENVIDAGHFVYFHGAEAPPMLRFETEGAFATMATSFRVTGLLRGLEVSMRVAMYGPGLLVVRTELPAPTAVLTVPLPIDSGRTRFRMLVTSEKPRFAPFAARLAAEIVRLRAAIDARRERAIWDHKIHLTAPRLSSVDRHIMPFRDWYGQFL